MPKGFVERTRSRGLKSPLSNLDTQVASLRRDISLDTASCLHLAASWLNVNRFLKCWQGECVWGKTKSLLCSLQTRGWPFFSLVVHAVPAEPTTVFKHEGTNRRSSGPVSQETDGGKKANFHFLVFAQFPYESLFLDLLFKLWVQVLSVLFCWCYKSS